MSTDIQIYICMYVFTRIRSYTYTYAYTYTSTSTSTYTYIVLPFGYTSVVYGIPTCVGCILIRGRRKSYGQSHNNMLYCRPMSLHSENLPVPELMIYTSYIYAYVCVCIIHIVISYFNILRQL